MSILPDCSSGISGGPAPSSPTLDGAGKTAFPSSGTQSRSCIAAVAALPVCDNGARMCEKE